MRAEAHVARKANSVRLVSEAPTSVQGMVSESPSTSSIEVGAVSGNSVSASTMRRLQVGQEGREDDEGHGRREAQEAGVLLCLAVARSDGADGREDGAVGEVAQHEVGQGQQQHRGVELDRARGRGPGSTATAPR